MLPLCKVVGQLYEIWGTNQLGMGVVNRAESGAFAGAVPLDFPVVRSKA